MEVSWNYRSWMPIALFNPVWLTLEWSGSVVQYPLWWVHFPQSVLFDWDFLSATADSRWNGPINGSRVDPTEDFVLQLEECA